MKISRNNYEVYFLDYHEGRISSEVKAELMKFLSENEDIEKEFYDFQDISIKPENIVFTDKNILKKGLSDISVINDENFDEFCVAKLEGDLLENENLNFEKFLNNNISRALDYKIYLKTLLEPDKRIVYQNKGELKRRILEKKSNSIYIWISVAASIALLVLVYFGFNKINEVKKLTKNEIRIVKSKDQHNEFKKTAQSIEKFPNKKTDLFILKNSNVELKQTNTIKDNVEVAEDRSIVFSPIPSINLSSLPVKNIKNEICFSKEVFNNNQEIQINNPANLKNQIISKINNVVNSKYFKDYFNNDRLDIKTLATSGMKSLEKFTGMKIKYDKETDTTGSRTIYAFNSKLLSFYSSHENK
jgi:hypothetical protein